jgi:2-methylisocitrate lyase-like PEP mutase family enzyme
MSHSEQHRSKSVLDTEPQEHLGFSAWATTSAGFAFSQGLPDSDIVVSRERSLRYIADIAAAVDLPVSADFASGYGVEPEEVADSVTRCVATGLAGLSVEDATGDPSARLDELPLAVERIRAARYAIDRSGGGVLLTARAECYHVGHANALRESIRRLQAYAEAGADVLFAAGPHTAEEINALVNAVRPKPFNLLVVRDIGLGVSDIAALDVRRISVGGALAVAAWAGFMDAAHVLNSDSSFAGLAGLAPFCRDQRPSRRRSQKASGTRILIPTRSGHHEQS